MTLNAYSTLVQQLHDGDTDRDLSNQLAEVLNECRKTGKPGSVTLTLDIKPLGVESVFIDAVIKTKIPEQPRESQKFYLTDELQLTRRRPGQLSLEDLKVAE